MINTKRLRCIIGFAGMLLPLIVLALSLIFGYGFPDSISATYFVAPCIAPFMIILGAAGVLLVTYNGYNLVDDILNTVAGLCGIGVCLFPCSDTVEPFIGTFNLPAATSNIIHNTVAISFFGILAYNSIFQFTKGSATPTDNKKKRNIIFRICGIGMLASFTLLLVDAYIVTIPHVIWWVETIALAFFGISWLTKADRFRILFADKK
jgi:hypothetical protein